LRKRNNYKRNPENGRDLDLPKCPICGKVIRNIYSAVSYNVTQTPAHLKCIIEELKKTNDLKENEKICYLGSGSFGIVQFRKPDSQMRLFIRKRIQYEDKNTDLPWRAKLPLKTSL